VINAAAASTNNLPMFRRAPCLSASLLLLAAVGAISAAQTPAENIAVQYGSEVKPLLSKYCYACHNNEKEKGEVNLARYTEVSDVLRQRKTWKTIDQRVSEKDMPPEEHDKQPSDAERKAITGWIASLKQLDTPDPGHITLHRLNRTEYRWTILDLFGVEFEADENFPKDDVSDGFDNIAQTLSLSPLLMEKYLLAADSILDQVLKPETVVLRAGAGALDAVIDGQHDAGQAEGTQRLLHHSSTLTRTLAVERPGDHVIAVRAGADAAGAPVEIAVSVDGRTLTSVPITASTTSPQVVTCAVKLDAGEHPLQLTLTVPSATAAPSVATAISRTIKRSALVENVEVLGPAPEPDAIAKRVLIAAPSAEFPPRAAAERIARSVASRAYRRPASDAQVALLMRVFDLAWAQNRGFTRSVKEMLKVVLVSPEFLFRVEHGQDDAADGHHDGIARLDGFELANRLSYFLWSSQPDDELTTLASEGRLQDDEVLRAQVRRMLADSRVTRFVENFAGQWLLLRNIQLERGRVDSNQPQNNAANKKRRSSLEPDIRDAMFAEGTELFRHILTQGRPVRDFIDPGYTFLNEALAKHYGIPGVTGPEMRLVQLEDRRRGGVLTMGALLAANSHPERTSPTRRGRWVLEEVLGKPPPPPPPDIPQLQFVKQKHPDASDRRILEIHRERPACAGCHRVMDPIGFGLENFDQQGRWRDTIHKDPVDASGELPGKKKFNGPAELKALIAEHADDLTRVLTERMLTYALGRALQYYDDTVIDQIVERSLASDGRFDTIVVETALSLPFRNRRAAP
jgi:Protein of unknown function (DUF1592)/Protein of unknown function (DUF1588)/Protein of unknown function (DUF1587)/Protein of unknown function (DUF1585)/Protein of unknown function (DUF1595)